MTAYILVSTTLVLLAALHAATAQARTVEQRINFLEHRQAVHQYICRRGANATRRFHCKALLWTTRELREARAEKHRRDYTVPLWPWLTLAHCEQRSGPRMDQVVWTAFSRSYEGAYGFWHERRADGSWRGSWQEYRSAWMPYHASEASPRVQTIVARRIQSAVGWGAWPACSIRLGLR